MGKQIDVLAIGDLCFDLIISGRDIVPEFGQKEKLVDKYSLEMGGSCSIFACQAAKLGIILPNENEALAITGESKPEDAVGAGDSFDGGFIYGFLKGKSAEECTKIGCICGSLNTRSFGGSRGQPWLDEMLKYL